MVQVHNLQVNSRTTPTPPPRALDFFVHFNHHQNNKHRALQCGLNYGKNSAKKLTFLICWFIQQILTPTFSFFLLSFFFFSHFFQLYLQHVTHVTNDANVTNVMHGCVQDGCTLYMDMNGCEWLHMGVRGWVCVGVYGTNFQNIYWRLDS